MFRSLLAALFVVSLIGFSGCGDSKEDTRPAETESQPDDASANNGTNPDGSAKDNEDAKSNEETKTVDENPDVKPAD